MKNNFILAIENVITVIVFAFLACFFEKWWIVLFSLLFILYFKIIIATSDGANSNKKK